MLIVIVFGSFLKSQFIMFVDKTLTTWIRPKKNMIIIQKSMKAIGHLLENIFLPVSTLKCKD